MGQTALIQAADEGYYDIVALLLERKANADLQTDVRRGHGHVDMGVG